MHAFFMCMLHGLEYLRYMDIDQHSEEHQAVVAP